MRSPSSGEERRPLPAYRPATYLHANSRRVAGEPVGALNRLFPHLYKIRIAAKALKRRTRFGYYALKWTLMAALLCAVFVPWRLL